MSGTLEDELVEGSNKAAGVAKCILCDDNQLPQTSSDLGSCEISHPVEVERVDESPVPHWRISVPQGAPFYQPQNVTGAVCRAGVNSHPEGSLYDQYHKDPRLFFVGAPSSMVQQKHPYAAQILSRTREDAIHEGQHRTVTVMPLDTYAIQRVESVVLPVGRHYSLVANWMAPPTFTKKESVKIQTGEDQFYSDSAQLLCVM